MVDFSYMYMLHVPANLDVKYLQLLFILQVAILYAKYLICSRHLVLV